MADLDLPWRDDLDLDPTGDLAMVDGPDQTEQHIVRRLLTSIHGYLFPKSYGLGLIQRIGNVATATNIAALVRAGLKLERTVATLPLPVVTVTKSAVDVGAFIIDIQYTDAVTGQPIALQFEVPSS